MSPLTIGILAATAMVIAKVVLFRWLLGKTDTPAPAQPGADPAPPPHPESQG